MRAGYEYFEISAVTGQGVTELTRRLNSLVKQSRQVPANQPLPVYD